MIWLGRVAHGRDNNFNLIRFIAALGVLVSHAWPIALGPGTAEPLEALTGHSLGGLAVYVFFATSGYFIAASFARSNSATVFLRARALRLFPGLAVSLLLVGFGIGLWVTSLPAGDYLSHRQTWSFVLRNLTLASPQYTLPGVFAQNPYTTVEGSIWTLFHEVLCYGLVFLAGIAGILRNRRAMTLALIFYGLLWLLPVFLPHAVPARLMQTRELSLPFVLGIGFWVWRDYLPLSTLAALGLLGLSALAKDSPLGFPLLILAVSYATFCCAYVPKGRIRAFNRLGDYSYGIYIYAFPLQGLVVWLAGPQSPLTNILLALPLTLLCAVLSWHLIEAPALAFGKAKDGVKAAVAPRSAPHW
jgi:peptidoglycan/LPS O-acetylase OafA/YrhL